MPFFQNGGFSSRSTDGHVVHVWPSLHRMEMSLGFPGNGADALV